MLSPDQFESKALAFVRVLVGLSLAFANVFLFLHPPLSLGIPVLAALTAVIAILFTLGVAVRYLGLALLLFHALYPLAYVSFGWELLVDPFLACIILSTLRGVSQVWLLRTLRLMATATLAWIAWSQIKPAPWLDVAMVARYVAHSPFAAVLPRFSGFIPLVEILGGFAWLLQLGAPLVLWHKTMRKAWGPLLLATNGLLTLFMPLAFFNLMVCAAVIPFLPPEWLAHTKEEWLSRRAEFSLAARAPSFVLIMLVMLTTVFDRNIAEQFDIFEKVQSATFEKTYEIATNPFVKFGNLILFNSIWKMYSPTWRHVVWIDWYAKDHTGHVAVWPQENFSPDYRQHRRSWLEALWTDFKKEKVFVGMLSRKEDQESYGRYLCHMIADQSGIKPVSVHPEINSFDIRGPEENWSIFGQKAERIEKGSEIACD